MVSSNKASFNLRENTLLPRNILHTRGVVAHRFTGQLPIIIEPEPIFQITPLVGISYDR